MPPVPGMPHAAARLGRRRTSWPPGGPRPVLCPSVVAWPLRAALQPFAVAAGPRRRSRDRRFIGRVDGVMRAGALQGGRLPRNTPLGVRRRKYLVRVARPRRLPVLAPPAAAPQAQAQHQARKGAPFHAGTAAAAQRRRAARSPAWRRCRHAGVSAQQQRWSQRQRQHREGSQRSSRCAHSPPALPPLVVFERTA